MNPKFENQSTPPRDTPDLVTTAVLSGELGGAARAAVVLNAGAALYIAGIEKDLKQGKKLAEDVLVAGKGTAALEKLRNAVHAELKPNA